MPLLAVVAGWGLLALNKRNTLLSNRTLIVFVLAGALVLGIPGLSGWLQQPLSPWIYLAAQSYYLLAGILFLRVYGRIVGRKAEKGKLALQMFTMVLLTLLAAYIFAQVYNVFHTEPFGYIGATSLLIFFIPSLFQRSYRALLQVPFEIYKVWEYPGDKDEIDFDGFDFDRLLVLDVEFSRCPDAESRLRVKAKAPSDISFGDWFRKFIDDYNYKFPGSTIEYIRPDGRMHSWVFYCKKSFLHRRRMLDPERTIAENGIRERLKITSKRVIGHFEEAFQT